MNIENNGHGESSASLRDFADGIRNNPSSILRTYTPERLEETR